MIPIQGCWVSLGEGDQLGIVIGHEYNNGKNLARVSWGRSGEVRLHNVNELCCGFRPGHVVQDVPMSNTRRPLGMATVIHHRTIAGRDMVLVQLHATGESRWLPYENLRRVKDAGLKYTRKEAPEPDSAERFRLKALAYALDSWNQVTGALDRLDVDPLPHQIDLVHKIMISDQTNWLIADDVGLGKTIEVGLLLAAMKRRGQARRVLVVCPAGVARQWKDEMQHKFNEDFRIYGTDFNITQLSDWSTFDKVIVSIDRAKSPSHTPVFGTSGDWDVIVFDEAHHLSKRESRSITQRYQLAERLRRHTDAFIFLSGTPHQGNTLQFLNLLRLLRPDLQRRFTSISDYKTLVSEVVLRNQKNLVTDAEGKFLFRGQDTSLVEVPLSDSALEFNSELQEYLISGYAASETGGATGRAIGFVMTIYRKLASSSIAAIERALSRRLARLRGEGAEFSAANGGLTLSEIEDAFDEGNDGLDSLDAYADTATASNTGANPFFVGEQAQISHLLKAASEVKKEDLKLARFFSQIVAPLYTRRQKLLIFTEYRATQEYIVNSLKEHYPTAGVSQINGSMALQEKMDNIADFNENAQFMVSTEAGGEGINLHSNCHSMVNYDLPWNPVRLVQRAGRLYRYGQKNRVMVFNLLANDTFDNKCLNMMLERVYSIAQDMAQVSPEFKDGLETEIIGELLERVDMASMLAANRRMDIRRSQDDIDEAVSKAKEAKTQQEMLFANVESYDPQAATAIYTFGQNDVLSFLEGILKYNEITIRNRLHNGRVLELELPEKLRGRFLEFRAGATVVRVTTDRRLAMRLKEVVPMDFKNSFFVHLIEFAKSTKFGGEFAAVQGYESGCLGIYKLRWQNDQGIPREESLLPVFLPNDGDEPVANPDFFGYLLSHPQMDRLSPHIIDSDERGENLSILNNSAHAELSNRCTKLRHPNDVVLLAAADVTRVD